MLVKRKPETDIDAPINTKINPLNQQPYSYRYYLLSASRLKLPIWQQRDEIMEALERDQVIFIRGETGSGKSTQVPHMILESAKASE